MTQVVEEYIAGSELFLVGIDVDQKDGVVEVTLDSMGTVTIDDCVAVNDAILAAFDRDREDFELTVGSYSISVPLSLRPSAVSTSTSLPTFFR